MRHRPQYHFLPPSNWMNDPNGLIQCDGQYHLFYQHNPYAATWGPMHWGHAVSRDLVQWEHWPIALAPTPNSVDQDGVWSGCAVNDNGVPTIIYTGVSGTTEASRVASPCLAVSHDGLRTWQKYPANPIIPAPPPGIDFIGYRDHSIWRDEGWWYHVIGAGIRYVGGTALLYRSPDLRTWEYLGPLLSGDYTRTEPVWTGVMWECPDLFRLGERHVLMISVWDIDPVVYVPRDRHLHHVAYFSGHFQQPKFTPDRLALVDYGASFYAPQSFTDDQGRRVMLGWLRETRPVEESVADGWSGCMTLPRVLSLHPDGSLRQDPAPELTMLRRAHRQWRAVPLTPANPLADVQGDCLEIEAEIEMGDAREVELLVRCSPDQAEQTRIVYNAVEGRLRVDTRQGRLGYAGPFYGQPAPLTLAPGESLQLRVFLDRSVIEVFANARVCLSERVYPTRDDSLGVSLTAHGGTVNLQRLDVWEIAPIW